MEIFATILLLSLVVYASSIPTDEWSSFKAKHNKTYNSHEEEQSRNAVFFANKQAIEKHNQDFNAGKVTYSLGVNEFSDIPNEEFTKARNGFISTRIKKRYPREVALLRSVTLPIAVNWTAQGAVTPVKDQKQCGSCWSFSTTGALEGQLFVKTGRLVSLSEQNILDCDTVNDHGCNGGAMQNAFKFVYNNKGLDTEASYPYTAVQGTCLYNVTNNATTDAGYVNLPVGNETALQVAVATIGPISVGIDASHPSLQSYKSGVYNEPLCNSSNINHGVLVVGYGTANGTSYWLVKNSWGTTWGLSGYMMMARNASNMCGIVSDACYPI